MSITRKKLLVIGCPRSGTTYTSKVMTKAGFPLGHECMDTFGTSSFLFIPKDATMKTMNLLLNDPSHHPEGLRSSFEFDYTYHQVRNPLHNIDSMSKVCSMGVRKWAHVVMGVPLPKSHNMEHLKAMSQDEKTLWAMHFYLIANRQCERQTSLRYRVEDFQANWMSFLANIGLPPGTPFPENVSTTTNRPLRFTFCRTKEQRARMESEVHNTSWSMLRRLDKSLCAELRKMASRYGY